MESPTRGSRPNTVPPVPAPPPASGRSDPPPAVPSDGRPHAHTALPPPSGPGSPTPCAQTNQRRDEAQTAALCGLRLRETPSGLSSGGRWAGDRPFQPLAPRAWPAPHQPAGLLGRKGRVGSCNRVPITDVCDRSHRFSHVKLEKQTRSRPASGRLLCARNTSVAAGSRPCGGSGCPPRPPPLRRGGGCLDFPAPVGSPRTSISPRGCECTTPGGGVTPRLRNLTDVTDQLPGGLFHPRCTPRASGQ